ncbi:MAG: UvrD-helicase domain-containing protein [Victivallaceae bacterium]|nr:UvrD-helicase domain-containing protein [Victivallaceae bacterium]
MNITDITAWDSERCPLDGIQLVEAAAGTGKTYSIQNLFVRMLLEKRWPADSILVVTYTNAATAELRDRIRKVLNEVRDYAAKCLRAGSLPVIFPGGSPDEQRSHALLHRATLGDLAKLEECAAAIRDALLAFDEAAIFTIHGFCERMLSENAFESGILFNTELLENADGVINTMIRDFIRRESGSPERWSRLSPIINNDAGRREFFSTVRSLVLNPGIEPYGALEADACGKDDYRRAVIPAAAAWVSRRFEEYKERENCRTFDDLLRNMAIRVENQASPLLASLRRRFNAAIIDEFQDTDAAQYFIFKTIFASGGRSLIMVGDPRQAIYGFRGGDIAAYRRARAQSPSPGTLCVNRRSGRNLIRAANTIFHRHPYPFLDRQIGFPEVLAPENPRQCLMRQTADGVVEIEQPLRVIFNDKDFSSPNNLARWSIPACADAVKSMLMDRSLKLPERDEPGLNPDDIAVLVFDNLQAAAVQEELDRLGIASVRAGAGNVFDTPEAAAMLTLLEAIAEPGRTSKAAAAMLTDYLGFGLDDLAKLRTGGDPDAALVEIQEKLAQLGRTYRAGSFAAMFGELFKDPDFRVRQRVAALPRGERKLTNMLQLRDLLHAESQKRRLSLENLAAWLGRQLSPETRENDDEDAQLLNLETDRAAVKIMTVFKSKGLEFPVVMLPTLFTRYAEDRARNFHAGDDEHLAVDLSGEAAAQASAEQLQEQLRLVYVALTRAAGFCCVWWGRLPPEFRSRTKRKYTTALDWLFRGRSHEAAEAARLAPPDRLTETVRAAIENCDPCGTLANLGLLADDVPASDSPDAMGAIPENRLAPRDDFEWRGQNKLEEWRIASFSALAPEFAPADTERDLDEDSGISVEPAANAVLALPRGKQLGTVWHEILEQLDFGSDSQTVAAVAAETVDKYALGIVEERPGIAAAIAERTVLLLGTPLADLNGNTLTLSGIPKADTVREMEFCFALGRDFSAAKLRAAVGKYAAEHFGLDRETDWARQLDGGLLTGFIDLVFRVGERFYLVDWKTNSVDGDPAGFTSAAMTAEMRDKFYFLQYLIYILALMRFLSLRLPGLTPRELYRRHFGGVFYIFLRGLSPSDPARGVFRDLPPYELIEELERSIG